MTQAVSVTVNANDVIDQVGKDLGEVFYRFGQRVRAIARNSMRPQRVLGTRMDRRHRTIIVWANDTPIGQPPRTRTGFIKNYINAALDTTDPDLPSVSIGPEQLDGFNTECLARLEFGDHPFMRPALEQGIDELPGIWKAAVAG